MTSKTSIASPAPPRAGTSNATTAVPEARIIQLPPSLPSDDVFARVTTRVPGDPAEVVLPAAGRLEVRVPALLESDEIATLTLTETNGRPFVHLDMGGEVRGAWQLVGGRTTVPGVPAGVWTASATSLDGKSWTGTVTTTGGPEVEVDLE